VDTELPGLQQQERMHPAYAGRLTFQVRQMDLDIRLMLFPYLEWKPEAASDKERQMTIR
jgi:hypothetical protein